MATVHIADNLQNTLTDYRRELKHSFSQVAISFDLNLCTAELAINNFGKNSPGQFLWDCHFRDPFCARFCDRLAKEFPRAVVTREPIFMKDGAIWSSAGITAGIDLSLALVEEDHGHEVALKIARFLVMYLVRPGGQAQFSHMLSHQAVTSKPLRELQVWMLENLREDLTVEKLADRVGMSPRHFTRVCLRETKMNPGQFVDRLRVEAAQQMIDSSNMGLKEVADACGFRSADAMRRAFLRMIGITASEYTERFRR